MMRTLKRFAALAISMICAVNLQAMEFDFSALSSLCRVEVNLATGFGSGTVRGNFEKIRGKINFSPERPSLATGQIFLNSRSLNFGHPQVSFDAHKSAWLDSKKFPEISFRLLQLTNLNWQGRELRSEANGILKIRGIERETSIPLSLYYLRNERRKYQGRAGDLIRLNALLTLPRSEFGIAPNDYLESILEEITVMVSITGVSDFVRPFLPSRLFYN